MHWISQNKNKFLIAVIFLLLMGNYNVLNFGIVSDFFGITVSVLLFIYGGRKTNIKVNYLLIFLILIFEFVSFRLHTNSLHFLSLLLLVCMVYYHLTKKFSFIALICILLFSSLFNKFFEHLTTEIKVFLCQSVFYVLENAMSLEKIEGVNFYLNGAKVTIDTACMGLSMFKTGLLFGAILLTLEEKKHGKSYSIFQIILFCLIIVLLNIISNYFRILLLILFHCTQENMLHHSIGLLCFALYQLAPMLLILKYFKPKKEFSNDIAPKPNYWIMAIMTIIVALTSLEMKTATNENLLENLSPNYSLKQGIWVEEDVFKITTGKKLIYIKTPSHKPLICWTGNGYKITKSVQIIKDNDEIWYNIMEKNDVIYESYWWYECDAQKYTSFVEVMFHKLVYNKTIRLINEVSVLEKK